MSMLRKCAGAEAEPHTIEWNGKVYAFGAITQAVKDRLSQAMYGRACRSAELAGLPPEKYAERLGQLNKEYLLGEWDFESEAMLGFLQTPAGFKALVAALTGCGEGEAALLIAHKGAEVQRVIALVKDECLPEEGPSPNALTPEQLAKALANASGRFSRAW